MMAEDKMNRRSFLKGVAVLGMAAAATPSSASPREMTGYVNSSQQTAVWFGARSHWLQPWRAYLDTVPTAVLRDAIGINLNVAPNECEAVCEHLHRHGFRRARIEFGWGSISWDHPDQLADPGPMATILTACRKWQLRPLLLLNANSGAPCPVRFYDVRLLRPAKKGDTVLYLDPDTTRGIAPGRSGLNNLTEYWAAEDIFTSLASDGTVTLSKPLPKDLPAGNASAATLKFLPFYPSKLKPGGQTPPQFTETMRGWLAYVKAITTEAKRVLGADGKPDAGFDVEIWNELTFGSRFLSINNYYQQPIADGDWAVDQIRAQTVAYIRDPKNDLPGVGIGDGFDNQWPWGAGSTAPPGLTALDKHPYAGSKRFPEDEVFNGITPLNALGKPDATQIKPNVWKDSFLPEYIAHFPEYFLTAIQTETLIRDLSPITTDIYGTPHGRFTHPSYPNGKPAPAPTMWITEYNIDPGKGMTSADYDRMKAKAVLRMLACYVNKGVKMIDFYAAKDNNPMGLGLVSNAFFQRIKEDGFHYPENETGLTSPTMLAIERLAGAMPSNVISRRRALSLLHILDIENRYQFAGDPKTAGQHPNPHPPLYNRDVLAFLPFQASDNHFVVALYIMTRNLGQLYQPNSPAGDPSRYDMPPEPYVLTIGGADGRRSRISYYDPLSGEHLPAPVRSRGGDRIAIKLELTDSVRLLDIRD